MTVTTPATTPSLSFVLTRDPRFDIAGPVVWQVWRNAEKEGRGGRGPPVTVTWVKERDGLREFMEGSGPWDDLFGRYRGLKGIYHGSFWGLDAKYPEIVEKMNRLNAHLAYR